MSPLRLRKCDIGNIYLGFIEYIYIYIITHILKQIYRINSEYYIVMYKIPIFDLELLT